MSPCRNSRGAQSLAASQRSRALASSAVQLARCLASLNLISKTNEPGEPSGEPTEADPGRRRTTPSDKCQAYIADLHSAFRSES
jgi:hypothetical protein